MRLKMETKGNKRKNNSNARTAPQGWAHPQESERERKLEEFRQMFREAYPDAAKFIESIHVIPRKPEFYFDNGGIACDGFVSARGVNRYNDSSNYESGKGRNGR